MMYGVVRVDVSTLKKRLVSVWENPDDIPGLLPNEGIMQGASVDNIKDYIMYYNTVSVSKQQKQVNTRINKEDFAMWNFDKLPEKEYNNVIEALTERNTNRLLLIHDRYELSKNQYCCLGPDRTVEIFDEFEFFMTQKGLI